MKLDRAAITTGKCRMQFQLPPEGQGSLGRARWRDTDVMSRSALVVFVILIFACIHASSPAVLLKGPWRSGTGSFDFEVRDEVILYEIDMKEYPYRLDGDLLIVNRGPETGVIRARILEVSRASLVLQYLDSGIVERYSRME